MKTKKKYAGFDIEIVPRESGRYAWYIGEYSKNGSLNCNKHGESETFNLAVEDAERAVRFLCKTESYDDIEKRTARKSAEQPTQ